eukprot:CAMPEP_0174761032 /NCGR_PEP_ID=MMETSP1094-20130205/109072_1 /TAXON_ID=156173 /ORGANISM="Chrysochromulina brevifilum, Strain UTEX LB 985" /LENGTH=46 /DNA_ID= /DNA_START= /DNA_END= /DNA_ORIENTATION=
MTRFPSLLLLVDCSRLDRVADEACICRPNSAHQCRVAQAENVTIPI